MNRYRPMLTQSADAPFSSDDWIFEVKWDGIRAIAYVYDELSIQSRNQKELKQNFPELNELESLAKNVVLDGEIITLRDGKPDFQALLERSQTTSSRDIEYLASTAPSTYVVFDILENEGRSVIDMPLMERKKLLAEEVREGKHVVLSDYMEAKGEAYYEAAMRNGLEGVVAKNKMSVYEPGKRSRSWLKIKEGRTCDCVIFGYTKGKGRRAESFGALILGLYDDDKPVYVGKVGTGFSDGDLMSLMEIFKGLKAGEKPLQGVDAPEEIMWLRPQLVCEVKYQVVTRDLRLRMPRFKRLRADKAPRECYLGQIKTEALEDYRKKRDFAETPEPKGKVVKGEGRSFVVHEHHARRLHFDLRLEREGVLKSWAIPKGVPLEPNDKRLAVETEDHPLEYGSFEGTIPEGQYGAGMVKIWDKGVYETLVWEPDKVEFLIKGERLDGRYIIVRLKKAGQKEWIIFKARD